jgi:hypothetical protein
LAAWRAADPVEFIDRPGREVEWGIQFNVQDSWFNVKCNEASSSCLLLVVCWLLHGIWLALAENPFDSLGGKRENGAALQD